MGRAGQVLSVWSSKAACEHCGLDFTADRGSPLAWPVAGRGAGMPASVGCTQPAKQRHSGRVFASTIGSQGGGQKQALGTPRPEHPHSWLIKQPRPIPWT